MVLSASHSTDVSSAASSVHYGTVGRVQSATAVPQWGMRSAFRMNYLAPHAGSQMDVSDGVSVCVCACACVSVCACACACASVCACACVSVCACACACASVCACACACARVCASVCGVCVCMSVHV